MNIKKIIAGEGLIALIVLLLALPIIIKFAGYIFPKLLPSLRIDYGPPYNVVGMIAGILYLVAVYWLIRLLIRFSIWAVKTLKAK